MAARPGTSTDDRETATQIVGGKRVGGRGTGFHSRAKESNWPPVVPHPSNREELVE